MGAYTLMFGHVFKLQHFPDFPVFLMIGLMAWTFFAQSLLAAAESLIDQGGIVRRARFPRETIPAAAVTVQLFTFTAILVLLDAAQPGAAGHLVAGLAAAAARAGGADVLLRARLRAGRGGAARLLPRRRADPDGSAAAVVLSDADLLRARSRSRSSTTTRSCAPCWTGSTRWRRSSRRFARSSTTAPRPTPGGWCTCSSSAVVALGPGRGVPPDGGRAGGGGMRRCPGAGGLRPGEIVLRDATRSFGVRADQTPDAQGPAARRPRRRARGCPGTAGRQPPDRARRDGRMVGRNGAGKTSTLRVLAGIVPLHSGEAACGGRVVSLLEFAGRLQPRLLGPREHLPAGRAVRDGQAPGPGADRADHRVLRARALHRHPGEDLLQGDVRPARLLDRRPPRRRRAADRRGAGGRRRGVPAQVPAADLRADRRRHHRRPGLPRRRRDRAGVRARGGARRRPGGFDGPTAEGLLFYHRLLGGEHEAGVSVRPHHERAIEVATCRCATAPAVPCRCSAAASRCGSWRVWRLVRARGPGRI